MTPSASVLPAAPPRDLFDTIAALRELVVRSYRELESDGSGTRSIGSCCGDPASGWAADAALRNRTLPINLATVKALEAALAGVIAHKEHLRGVTAG